MRKRTEIKAENLDEEAKLEKQAVGKGRPSSERSTYPTVLHLPDDPSELMKNINLLNQTSINRSELQLSASINSQLLQQPETQTLLRLDGSIEKFETSMSSGTHDASEKLRSGIVCHLDDAGSPPMIIAAEPKEEGTCAAPKIDILNQLSSNYPHKNPPSEPNQRGPARGRQKQPSRSQGKTSHQNPLEDCASDLTKQNEEQVHHASATSDDHKLGRAPRKTPETRKLGTSSVNHNRFLSNSQKDQGKTIQSSSKMTQRRNQDCDSVGNIQIKTQSSVATSVAGKNSPKNASSATFQSNNLKNRKTSIKLQSSSDSCKNSQAKKNMNLNDQSKISQVCGSKRKGGQICNLELDSNKNGNTQKQQNQKAASKKNANNFQITSANIGSVKEQIKLKFDVIKEENLQIEASQISAGRETRSARRQTAKDAIDYSLYFEDYDYLSEEEEIKKKRELKRSQKSIHANKRQEIKASEHVQFSKDHAESQLKDDQSLDLKGVEAQKSNTEFGIKASNVLPNKQKDIISSPPLLLNEKKNKSSTPKKQNPKAPLTQKKKTAEKLNQVQADPKTIATLTRTSGNYCSGTQKVNKLAMIANQLTLPQGEQSRTEGEVSIDKNFERRVALCEEEKSADAHRIKVSDALGSSIMVTDTNFKEYHLENQAIESVAKKQELFLLLQQPVAQSIFKLDQGVSSKIAQDFNQKKNTFRVPLPLKSVKPDQIFNIKQVSKDQNLTLQKVKEPVHAIHSVPQQENKAKTDIESQDLQRVQLKQGVDGPITFDAPSMSQPQPKILNLEEVKEVDQYCLPEVLQQDTNSDQIQQKSGMLGVINPFDRSIRCMKEVDFIDFNNKNTENNQYKPALIQQEQQQDALKDPVKFAETNHSSGQTHFIHKKQSQCIIRRITGVSYVKKSESKQLNVRDRYEKLAPIVIQGSYHLPKFEDKSKLEVIKKITHETFYSPFSYFICTAFESANEVSMKNYILKPHQRLQICKGNVWLVRSNGLQDCWRFIKDKYFFCIHLMYDQEQIIRNIDQEALNDNAKIAQFIQDSDVCLGILTKRGTASIKSMLKVYKLENEYNEHLKQKEVQNQAPEEVKITTVLNEENPELLPKLDSKTGDQQQFDIAEKLQCPGAVINGINTMGLMLRMELYVDEHRWKSLDNEPGKQSQVYLNSLIQNCEEQIVPTLLHWNSKRISTIGNKIMHRNDSIYKIDLTSLHVDEEQRPKKRPQSLWEPLSISEVVEGYTKLEIDGLENLKLDDNPIDILNQLKNSFPTPVTLINTRDCFVNDLYVKQTIMNLGPGRENVIKREYYFTPETVPENYRQVVGLPKDYDVTNIENLRVGVTSYFNFYTDEELKNMERCIEDTEKRSLENTYLPMTAQKTFAGNQLKRTKFFFGYRYMWTKCQLLEPLSNVAAGVRADVSQPPVWMKSVLEDPLVKAKIIEKDFINSIALNVYHDGSEGLAQHFDDATRFKQPIYTVRLFSDSRLSFGSQFYGFCNGAFFVPLPRGCICVMEEGSYSANGVKHCIRPCDMTGKSSAVILRQMHPNVVKEAVKYDQHVDLPMWMSSLCLENKAIPYYQQKEFECQAIEKVMLSNASQGNGLKHMGMQGGACGEGGSTHQSTLQTLEVTSNYSVGKKRGPRITPESLEKKVQLQKQKDDREIKKVIDDMIKNIEDKHKREQDFYKRFKVVSNEVPQASENTQEQRDETTNLPMPMNDAQYEPKQPSLNIITEEASVQLQANQQITHPPIIFESQRIRQPHLTLPLPNYPLINNPTPKLPPLMPFIIERAFRSIHNPKQ